MLELISEIEKFGKRLEQHCIIKKDISPILLKLKISEDNLAENDTRCLAVVENYGSSPYQCNRKRKEGFFCGLHSNKKNNFKRVDNRIIIKEIRTFKFQVNADNTEIKTNKQTTSYLFDFIDKETFRIEYMNNVYRINKNNLKVWFEDTNDLIYIGLLPELDIPIKIY